MYSKDKIVECIGNGMYLPSNQKQIKSPLITSDAVSCCPVTITIININEGASKPKKNQEQTKISFRFFFPDGVLFPCALLSELDKSISFYHSLTQFPVTTTALLYRAKTDEKV